jgi:hypothetical protein
MTCGKHDDNHVIKRVHNAQAGFQEIYRIMDKSSLFLKMPYTDQEKPKNSPQTSKVGDIYSKQLTVQ